MMAGFCVVGCFFCSGILVFLGWLFLLFVCLVHFGFYLFWIWVFFFFISFLLLLAESKGGNRVTGILYHGLEMGLIQATER